MSPDDFDEFYTAVHGKDISGEEISGFKPFEWQSRLAKQVARDSVWPKVIKLPTSSGKTSIIDIAVFHLALEAELPAGNRSARLRTFFVVDRRIVVDEAAEHARELQAALEKPESEVVRAVADRLKLFGATRPLDVAVLRGGMYRDNTWANEPNQPLVCVSTVDQVGSRLLFRGYQISDEQRPVHAGLVANDSLLFVDEAHLSKPFLDTLDALSKYRDWSEIKIGRPLCHVQMSATAAASEDPFELDYDKESDVLKIRLNASKRARLSEGGKFEDEAVKHARALATEPGANVVGVVVNTVASARKIFEQFKGGEAILLTGRIRPWDREQIIEKYWNVIRACRPRTDEKLFVVATQTVEVGANIDFDALVTEAAPLDALRQRFGRLDRMGKRGVTSAVILLRKESKPNPIYGEPLVETWKWLKENAPEGQIDFGVQALSRLPLLDAKLNTKTENGPLLFPAHIETWVQTDPEPDPDPDIAPFLHGPKALEAADVQIVWRADLNAENHPRWFEIVSLAPPVLMEGLPVPISAARRWLEEQPDVPLTDLEGIDLAGEEPERKMSRGVLLWRGPAKSDTGYARQIRPGDTIVVPATYGGADEWGWFPSSRGPVSDIGNACSLDSAKDGWRAARLRIHPDVPFLEGEERQRLLENLKLYFGDEDPDDRDAEALGEIKNQIAERSLKARITLREYDGSGLILTWKMKRKPKAVPPREYMAEESGEGDSSSLTCRMPLQKHVDGVTRYADLFASKCGLDQDLCDDLMLAARLHDLGKWDPRFQQWVLRNFTDEILGKSDDDNPVANYRQVLLEDRYPRGARHEFASVALVWNTTLLNDARDPELVLHLIGSHHGHGRPFAPVWFEDPSFRVRAKHGDMDLESSSGYEQARLDSGWTERFWRLNRKYGYWGLAYLEAILRRADCVQ